MKSCAKSSKATKTTTIKSIIHTIQKGTENMTPTSLGLKYLLVGIIFFLNPNINIIDVMPDFIGCLFMTKGLYAISQIYPHFNDSATAFRRLAIVSAAKTISLPVLFITSTSEITWFLLLSFVFGCLEIVYGIVSFNRLFEGFYYSAQRGDSDRVFDRYDGVKLFTTCFVFFKSLASIIPEITSLSSEDYGTVTENGIVSAAKMRLPLMVFFFAVALIVGIIWYIYVRKYLKNVVTDEKYLVSLCKRYVDLGEDSKQLTDRRTVLESLSLLTFAAIASIELKLDGINYIPHIIGGFLFLLAFLRVKDIFPKVSKVGKIFSVIYMSLSAVGSVFSVVFTKKYIISSENSVGMAFGYGAQLSTYLGSNEEITRNFIIMCAINALEAILFTVIFILSCKVLRGGLLRHGGKPIYELGQMHDLPVILRTTRTERIYIVFVALIGVASAVLSVLQTAFVTSANLWLPDIALRIAWVALYLYTCDKIRDSVKEKYIYIKAEETA